MLGAHSASCTILKMRSFTTWRYFILYLNVYITSEILTRETSVILANYLCYCAKHFHWSCFLMQLQLTYASFVSFMCKKIARLSVSVCWDPWSYRWHCKAIFKYLLPVWTIGLKTSSVHMWLHMILQKY